MPEQHISVECCKRQGIKRQTDVIQDNKARGHFTVS